MRPFSADKWVQVTVKEGVEVQVYDGEVVMIVTWFNVMVTVTSTDNGTPSSQLKIVHSP